MFRTSLTVAVCFLVQTACVRGSPTQAPTYRVKTEAEIKFLADCASSRGTSANDVYTEPEATTLIQTRRSDGILGFDVKKKLNEFDYKLLKDMMNGQATSENKGYAQDYAGSIIWAAVPSMLLVLATFFCVIPCWCCKTIGEVTAFCCRGKGCCGSCNDYFCGLTCLPNFGIFDGFFRYAPVADYPTFLCWAHYERDPNMPETNFEEGESVPCRVCFSHHCGKQVELRDDQEYHQRDDFFAQRLKPMESRISIPNIAWIGVMILVAVGIVACGIPGQVLTVQMMDGIKEFVDEGNCAIADSIDFVEGIARPITNITQIATNVISDTRSTISSARSLNPQMTAIADALSQLATTLRTDTCNLNQYFTETGDSYPPPSVGELANTVDDTATTVNSEASGSVSTLDNTLNSLDATLVTANKSLVSASAMAKKVTDGKLMSMLKDDVAPMQAKLDEYTDAIAKWQGIGAHVIFGMIYVYTIAVLVVATIWLIATEIYECEQTKCNSRRGTNHEGNAVGGKGIREAEGEYDDDDDGLEVPEKSHCCGDCCCAIFQLLMIWTMHIFHFVGWLLMVVTLVLALVFNPSSILMSDGCVAADHFVSHAKTWLKSPGSPFENYTMVVDAATACLDIQDGNILDALDLSSQFDSFTNVSFGDASSVNVDNLNFSMVDTMVQESNAMTVSSIYDFDTKASTLLTQLNALTTPTTYTLAQCYDADATTLTCAPANAHSSSASASAITGYRDALLALYDAKFCSGGLISNIQGNASGIKDLVNTLESDMKTLQTALGGASGAMDPVKENIDALKAAGSCNFVRRRFNGILTGVCGNTLAGVRGLGWTLLCIGLALYVFTMVLNHCAIPRFRMYDVACWHHERTKGCCPLKQHHDDEDDVSNLEMVNKYSSGTQEYRAGRAVVV
jgi:hypothetical protein